MFFKHSQGNALTQLKLDVKWGKKTEAQLLQDCQNENTLQSLVQEPDDLKTLLNLFSELNKVTVMNALTLSDILLRNLLVDLDSFHRILKLINKTYHERIINFIERSPDVLNKLIYDEESQKRANSICQILDCRLLHNDHSTGFGQSY